MLSALIILFTAALTGAAEFGALSFGGYVESGTTLLIPDEKEVPEQLSAVVTARAEASWALDERGGADLHLVFSSALQPLDPFAGVRPESRMGTLYSQLAAGALAESEIAPEQMEGWGPTLRHLPYSSFFPKDRVVLDRAVVKLFHERFDLYLGKQTIAWGTGYGFNPTDIWNHKNPLDPEGPRAGVAALRAEIPLGPVALSAVAAPGADFKHSSGGFRLKSGIGRFDWSVSGIRVHNADRALLGLPPKLLAGADMAGEIGTVGVWAEAALNNPRYPGMCWGEFDSLYLIADAGLDYTFSNGLYAMAEYYYHGLGETSAQRYTPQGLLHLLAGEAAGLGRHYLMGGISYRFGNHLQTRLFALGNLADRSAMILPGIEYTYSDNITIELTGHIGAGNRDTSEYGSLFPGVSLKAAGYF